ncbi:MAG: glycosyltransferase family 87 protein [Enhydrobacter sp.]
MRVAAIFCAAVGVYDLLYVYFILSGGPAIGPRHLVLFPDFRVFDAAVHAWREGKLALIYDVDAFSAFQNAGLHFRPFLYPPIWLLMLLPLGAIAVGKTYAAFMTATAAIATALEGWRDWPGWLAVVVSPAAAWVVLSGQNTFLSLGLFYGGLHLLPRAPIAAGVLLGLLAYKPQIWVLVPLALLAARQWKTLAVTLATVAVLALTSLALFGLDFWRGFFDAARIASSAAATERMFDQMHVQMTTLLAAARMAGLSTGVAGLLQIAGALLAVAAVWFAFRRHGPGTAQTAVLAAATFLVSPYTLNYDLLLLMPAVVALHRRGAAQGFLPGERILHALLWLLPTLGWMLNQLGLPVIPLVVLLFGATAWKRAGGHAKTA